MTKFNTNPPKC